MQVLRKTELPHLQSVQLIFSKLARTWSSNITSSNSCHIGNITGEKVYSKMHLMRIMNLRLLSTCTSAWSEVKPDTYQPKIQEVVVQPERKENPSPVSKKFQNFLFKKMRFITRKALYRSYGIILYSGLVGNINYQDFFEAFSMPDTFQSWFIIMELHVWMLCVRLMAEGPDGKLMRNMVLEAMWDDVRERAKSITSQKQLEEYSVVLGSQFNAAFLGYDEGLLGNDKTLASALWRRFFNKTCTNPHQLESMISFTRKQIHLLDSLTREEIIDKQKIILLRLTK